MFRTLPDSGVICSLICYFFVNSVVVWGVESCHPEFLPNRIYPGLLICVFADLAEGEI